MMKYGETFRTAIDQLAKPTFRSRYVHIPFRNRVKDRWTPSHLEPPYMHTPAAEKINNRIAFLARPLSSKDASVTIGHQWKVLAEV